MPNGDEITYVLMSEIDVNGVVLKVKDAEAQSAIALNNIAISTRINDLNTRLEAIENPSYSYANVQIDWNELDTTSYSYIKNKPDLSVYLTQETQPDWEEDDTTNASYIQNKPTIPTVSNTITENDTNAVSGGAVYSKFADLIGSAPAALDTLQEIAYALNNDADLAGTLSTQISTKIPKVSNPAADNFASFNSDGTVKDSGVSASSFITNETQPDWEEDDTTSAAYIQNKPDLTNFLTQETQSDWDENDTTSVAYIQNKPDLSVYLTQETQSNWNETNTSSAAYIQNKPDLSNFLTQETQSDWEENDTTSVAYIQNKPDLSHFLITETKSNWNETNTSSAAYIQNKPDLSVYLTQETQSDWSVTDTSSAAYIQNKPDLSIYLTQETQSDWSVTDTSSAAYIQNKPTIPTVSTVVTENDTNAVSGGAVYSKFADLIGSAPAALDTLQEIAYALNNDADLAGTLTTQISTKIPKVSNPTTGNFASLASDGTLVDSSYTYSDFLTEHQSIKTVNNESLIGTGNIVVSGLPQVSSADNGKILMVVNGQWQLVSPSVLYSGQGLPNNAQGNNGDLYMQTD